MSRTHTGLLAPMRHALCLLLALLIAAGPLLAPRPARADLFGDFPIEKEKELGKKYNTLMRARLPIIEDPEISGYIRGIVERINAQVPHMPFELKTSVVLNHHINAFAAPAGYVYVFTGLITNFEHEAELAGVIAHELAHVSHRHIAGRIKQQQVTQLGMLAGMLAGMFMGAAAGGDSGAAAGNALAIGSLAGGVQTMLNYSRVDEREADQSGLKYLVAAGYNPTGMVSAFKKIKKKAWLAGAGNLPKYLSTHPAVEDRITFLSSRIGSMPSDIQNRPLDDSKFQRIKTLITARYLDPQLAISRLETPRGENAALSAMGQGIVYSRENKIGPAREAFASAVDLAPNDPLVLREAGRFHYLKGDPKLAASLLQKAVLLNSKDLMALFYFARLLGDNGDTSRAIDMYRRVLAHLPEDSEVHYHLGRVLGESGNLFEGHLHLAYSAIYGLNKKKSRFHLEKAESLVNDDESRKELFEQLKKVYAERAEFW